METFIKSYIKKIATDFFYYWWNTPGNNTDQGFDEWWEKHAKDYPVEIPEITDERFKMPTDKQLVEIALLFNDGKLQKSKLRDMIAMCEFVLDRLYENNDVTKPSSKE